MSLSVQDLKTIRTLIIATNQRGSLRPEELVVVGTLFNKLTTLLNSLEEQSQNDTLPSITEEDGDGDSGVLETKTPSK